MDQSSQDRLLNHNAERLRAQFQQMQRIRAFENAAVRSVAEKLTPGGVHASIGQEAIAVGVCGNLRRDDIMLSNHRGHAHTMAKGADPLAMMRELFGRVGGTCGGKGGSMHIADFSVGMLGANGVLADSVPISVGAAHVIKLRGEDRVVVCFFGDGAINRGPFLEGLNWAGVFELPVLFVCEDNGFAATTRTASVTAGPGPAARATSIGIEAVTIDGNDIGVVDEVATDLIARARAGRPQVLVANTYRLAGHHANDAATYRTKEEVAEKWLNDPIALCQVRLLELGVPQADLTAIETEAQLEMANAYRLAAESPWPDVAMAYSDVQDIGAPMRGEY